MKPYALYPTDALQDLQGLVRRCTQKFAGKDAFRIRVDASTSRSVTYAQFGEDLSALGNALMQRGLTGQRYAILGENMYEWVLCYLAGTNSNTTVVPLDKELMAPEIIGLVKRTGVCAFFYSDTYADVAQAVGEACDGITFINLNNSDPPDGHLCFSALLEEGRALLREGKDAFSHVRIDREKPCAILFTSGTTGASKGVMLSHANIASNVVAACQMVLFYESDVLMSVLPIHHSFECTCGILCMLHYGTTICFNANIKDLPSNLQLFRPTAMFLVPLYVETFLKRIWKHAEQSGKAGKLRTGIRICNLLGALGIDVRRKLLKDVHAFFGGRLRKIVVGGAYAHPSLAEGFREFGIEVLQGYGITECSPLVAVNREKYYVDDSAGLIVPCCEARIDADPLLTGELLVRGTNVMLGYLDDPAATDAVFDGEWFRTGDIGYLDKDGFLHITGRSRNIIVLKNGKNVSPEEIEAHFHRYPLVAQAVVTPGDVDKLGVNSLIAMVYPNPELAEEMDPETLNAQLQDIIDGINRKLPAYMQLAGFTLRDTPFPQTASKKIIRYKINA